MKAILNSLHAPVYQKRLDVLVELIGRHTAAGESLLDVGCGAGVLGYRVGAACGLRVAGLETRPRRGCLIPVEQYDGHRFPLQTNSADTVLIADMLHHAENPLAVLKEAGRVAAKRVIVKDHKLDGWCAHGRLALIDWLANAGHGVPCLYHYFTLEGWHSAFAESGLTIDFELKSVELYQFGLNLLFGRNLQYFVVLEPE